MTPPGLFFHLLPGSSPADVGWALVGAPVGTWLFDMLPTTAQGCVHNGLTIYAILPCEFACTHAAGIKGANGPNVIGS